jgi:hypothetical protein
MLNKLTKKLEKLFDNPLDHKQHALALDEIKKAFVLSEDNQQIDHLSYIFSQTVGKKDTALLFSQLSSFFEMGFLFEKSNSEKYQVTQMFVYSLQMKKLDGLPLVRLPRATLFKVLETDSQSFLTRMKLSDYDETGRMGAFLIRISETETLILLSSLADPWAKVRLASLQNALMKIQFE